MQENKDSDRLSEHREQIDRIYCIYRLAKKFKGLVPGGISQVGEVCNWAKRRKKAIQE